MNNDPFHDMALSQLYNTDSMTWAKLDHHTWSCKSEFEFLLIGLTIQHFIQEVADSRLALKEGKLEALEVAPDRSVPVMCEGIFPFIFEGKLYNYDAICEHGTNSHTIRGAGDVNELVQLIERLIREHNPFRGQYLRVSGEGENMKVKPMAPPEVACDSIVLPKGLTFDILEREVIGTLGIGESCGSIFHGLPGVGKSLTCRYLAGRAKAAGFTTVEIISRVDYSVLQTFTRYLGPTLLLLEDIDVNVGEDRSSRFSSGSSMSDFLQSLSGISEGPEPVSVVATTNDIEMLDKAIRNRPGRFNRKWEFCLPEPEQVESLLEVYFGKDTLSPAKVAEIAELQLTGDLVRELHRTARVTARETKRPIAECIDEALEILKTHFQLEDDHVGFLA